MDTEVHITKSTADLFSLISEELDTETCLPDEILDTQPLVLLDLAPDITLEDLSTDQINDINEIRNKKDDEVEKMTERLTSLNILEHIPRPPSVPKRKIQMEKMEENDCPEAENTLEDRPPRSDKGRRGSVASVGNRRGSVTGLLGRRDSTSSLAARGDSTSSLGSRRGSSDGEGLESHFKSSTQRRNSSVSTDGDQDILTQFRISQRKERRSSAATLDMFTTLWKVRTAAINGLKSRRSKSLGRAESQNNDYEDDTGCRESRLPERGRRMSLVGYDRRPSMSHSVSSNSRSPSPASRRGSEENHSAENSPRSPRSSDATLHPYTLIRHSQNRRGSLRPISPVQEDSFDEESIHAVKNSNLTMPGLTEEQGTETPVRGRRRHSIHDLASVVAASKRFSQMAKQKIVQAHTQLQQVPRSKLQRSVDLFEEGLDDTGLNTDEQKYSPRILSEPGQVYLTEGPAHSNGMSRSGSVMSVMMCDSSHGKILSRRGTTSNTLNRIPTPALENIDVMDITRIPKQNEQISANLLTKPVKHVKGVPRNCLARAGKHTPSAKLRRHLDNMAAQMTTAQRLQVEEQRRKMSEQQNSDPAEMKSFLKAYIEDEKNK